MPEHADTRVLIFIVAYNAETTIEKVLRRIPREVLAYDYEILIIDDESADRTFEIALECKRRNPSMNITVLYNPDNQGYGGNQKIGYQYAIENGFDVVALLHGDGQYAPELLDSLIRPVAEGRAEAVFGSRMARGRAALAGGMPLYKYVGNRILTFIQNRLLRMRLTEFHSGYRVYSVDALRQLPFQYNTSDFHFDTEIIIQFGLKGYRIIEVPIPTYYGDEVCHVNGMAYAWNVVKATVAARLHRMSIFFKRQYDIYEPEEHYPPKLGFASSHAMAIDAVAAGAAVLDIGCGPGHVGRELERKGCDVQGVDSAPDLRMPLIKKFTQVDLDHEDVPYAADDFDYVLLLDVIEHLDPPAQFRLMDRLRDSAVARKPTVMLTTPNVAFLPVRLLLLAGQFNYGRRGILDLTHRHLFTFRSFRRFLNSAGYRVVRVRGVPAPFPLALGDNVVSRALVAINKLLIRLLPSVFSYQIYVEAVPLSTTKMLLRFAQRKSLERSAADGRAA
jgi:glycosyltransferase involved in cell wall biosynthesis